MNLYRIANWELLFETCETKKLASLKWVPTPNKHDGLSFRRVAAHEKRCELFAAWNLMLQIASKARKPADRGLLQRDGKPLSPDDMAIMTGFPAKIFELALTFFSSEQIGWLAVANQQPPATAGSPPDDSGENPAEGNGRKGREGNISGVPPEGGSDSGNPHKLSPMGLRIAGWFSRKPSTKWSDRELRELRRVEGLKTPEEDIAILEAAYVGKVPYIRKDVLTLLNNWNGEIDRAKQTSAPVGFPKLNTHRNNEEDFMSANIADHPV